MISVRANVVIPIFCFHKDEISLRPEYFLSFSNDAHVIFDTKILLLGNLRLNIKCDITEPEYEEILWLLHTPAYKIIVIKIILKSLELKLIHNTFDMIVTKIAVFRFLPEPN